MCNDCKCTVFLLILKKSFIFKLQNQYNRFHFKNCLFSTLKIIRTHIKKSTATKRKNITETKKFCPLYKNTKKGDYYNTVLKPSLKETVSPPFSVSLHKTLILKVEQLSIWNDHNSENKTLNNSLSITNKFMKVSFLFLFLFF